MNDLSLEERTVGFLLKTKDNVTSYGPILSERQWIIPLLSRKEEDYALLRNVGNGYQLECPERADYIDLVQRNPFVGLPGEEAFAIHNALEAVIRKRDHSLLSGLILYARSSREGYFSFFLGLAERLGVYRQVQDGFEASLDKLQRSFRWQQFLNLIFRTPDYCDVINRNLTEFIPASRREVRTPTREFTPGEVGVMKVLAALTPDSLRKYSVQYLN